MKRTRLDTPERPAAVIQVILVEHRVALGRWDGKPATTSATGCRAMLRDDPDDADGRPRDVDWGAS